MTRKPPEVVPMKRDDPLNGRQEFQNSVYLPWKHRLNYDLTNLQGHSTNIG